jgi:hypothetical protein
MFHICSHINMSNEHEPDQPPQYDPMVVCPRNTRRHDALEPPPRPVSEDHLAFMEGEARRLAAHDFSAGDFDWVPVPRRRHNADGWTVARQQAFIRLLADTGSVDRAAFVGMTPHSCYRLRRQPGAEGFARAWAAAIEAATDRLMDTAMERVLYGTPKRVCDGDGRLRHTEYVYNDRLLMFMLRAHRPARPRNRVLGLTFRNLWASGMVEQAPGIAAEGLSGADQARSNRSAFITLVHALTKAAVNASPASAVA